MNYSQERSNISCCSDYVYILSAYQTCIQSVHTFTHNCTAWFLSDVFSTLKVQLWHAVWNMAYITAQVEIKKNNKVVTWRPCSSASHWRECKTICGHCEQAFYVLSLGDKWRVDQILSICLRLFSDLMYYLRSIFHSIILPCITKRIIILIKLSFMIRK